MDEDKKEKMLAVLDRFNAAVLKGTVRSGTNWVKVGPKAKKELKKLTKEKLDADKRVDHSGRCTGSPEPDAEDRSGGHEEAGH